MNIGDLRQMQGLPLEAKVIKSQERIKEWYDAFDGNVYVAFSGGKDSTVLLHLVRSIYPDVEGVFLNTGLEYPEIVKFVKETSNITTIRPDITFREVIQKYGFPVVSKEQASKIYELQNHNLSEDYKRRLLECVPGRFPNRRISLKWQYLIDAPFKISSSCCDYLKKNPIKKFEKTSGLKRITGEMVSDSMLRTHSYLKVGCNSLNGKIKKSTPLAFWLEKDIWDYMKLYNIDYSNIYDMGYKNTGCMFCMFGLHLQKSPNKFQLMKDTHPKLYDYCINNLGCGKVMDYLGVKYE